MTKSIMYCPLNDGHIVKMVEDFSQEKFEKIFTDEGRLFPYGKVKLTSDDDFQKHICSLPALPVECAEILHFDTVVADETGKNVLDAFWKKNHMELSKPSIPPSTRRELYFVVAAILQLKARWAAKHKAKQEEYLIDKKDSFAEKILTIKGFELRNVGIALNGRCQEEEVSACIDLGSGIDIRLSDLSAFGDEKEVRNYIHNEYDLLKLINESNLYYGEFGTLTAPCIEEKCMVSNHLHGINWKSSDKICQVHIDESEALTKLMLNENGVEARAETVAKARMLVTCSARSMPRSYHLTIKYGLIVDIRYRKQTIFLAYVPQELFINA